MQPRVVRPSCGEMEQRTRQTCLPQSEHNRLLVASRQMVVRLALTLAKPSKLQEPCLVCTGRIFVCSLFLEIHADCTYCSMMAWVETLRAPKNTRGRFRFFSDRTIVMCTSSWPSVASGWEMPQARARQLVLGFLCSVS